MNKRILVLLLAVLLLAVGCGGSEKILSTEGVPQEVLQSAQYKAAQAEETATVIAYNYVPLTPTAPRCGPRWKRCRPGRTPSCGIIIFMTAMTAKG